MIMLTPLKWILFIYVSVFGVPTHAYNLETPSYSKCQERGQKFKREMEKGSIRVKYFCRPAWSK